MEITGYTISPSLNPNKVFLVHKNDLDKRLDPFYYLPSLVDLEKKVLSISPKKLRDYVLSISSGATPDKDESEKYYSDKENGIPFLRVQNLSPTGIIDYSDCKYINPETHNGMLKRSQVAAGDLLIKITGVGRMAVASVVPDNFEGNINQHICVVKTGSKEISQILAAYLNSDIAEKLASRRSTGGTRPALDYPALLSIPVIYNSRIFEIAKKTIDQKNQFESQADKLLSGIDDYLLNELGITLPVPPENTLKNRIFKTSLKQVSGNRFDPFYNNPLFSIIETSIKDIRYEKQRIKEIFTSIKGVVFSSSDIVETGFKVLRANNIDLRTNELILEQVMQVSSKLEFNENQKLYKGDILMSVASGSKEHVGKVVFIDKNMDYYFGGFMMVLRTINSLNNSKFLFEYLQSKIFRTYLFKFLGGTNINNLNFNMIKSLFIPMPSPSKQKEIADHITAIRRQAQQLKHQTKTALENASKEIEKILLNE